MTTQQEFEKALMITSGITADEAATVRAYYVKHRFAEFDIHGASIRITHHAFMDRDTILRALEQAT